MRHGNIRISHKDAVVVALVGGKAVGDGAIGERDVGGDVAEIQRMVGLVLQTHGGEDHDLVDALFFHGRAGGVDARGISVLGMGPDGGDFTGSEGRLLLGNHIDCNRDADHKASDDGGDYHVAGAFG